jgi:hypothetical protein
VKIEEEERAESSVPGHLMLRDQKVGDEAEPKTEREQPARKKENQKCVVSEIYEKTVSRRGAISSVQACLE